MSSLTVKTVIPKTKRRSLSASLNARRSIDFRKRDLMQDSTAASG